MRISIDGERKKYYNIFIFLQEIHRWRAQKNIILIYNGNFLKKYSAVPNGFIKDFFSISKDTYDDKDLKIDFNIVVKWLNVQKAHLKRLLVKYFSENHDYVIEKVKVLNKNGPGSNYVENIMITPDTFKELCMISQTAKAKEVRFYYLSIEKLIKKYHIYIEEKLNKKINLLERNQKPKLNIKGGVIYFFKALNNVKTESVEEDLYKLGKAKNIKNRFNTYNSGNANDIEPLFILEVNDIDKVEKCIKNLMSDYQYRKRKEVYRTDVDTLKTAFVECDSLVHGFKKYVESNEKKLVDHKLKKMRHSKNGLFLLFKKNQKKKK